MKVSAEKAAREMGAAFANAGLGGAPNPEIYPFFAGLVAAGATGALVRSVTWNPDETAPGRSVVLGGIAGFVVGAASVLSHIDYNAYYGLGVIVITVPPQKEVSYVGEDTFWRVGDATEKATTAKDITSLAGRF